MNTVRSPISALRNAGKRNTRSIWALKDVNFDVRPGEVLGIIGRNGAGKSTLLKILSRITEPTTGSVELYGRVGSLLEVGTGFHAELTGRENVFLNGSILGMRRNEIQAKFDEIVAFAEIEQFMETPVKRYSSGMYLRLAFAVAAYLEPEILVVDEVLAVGDAAFQKKCVGKMGEVARQGRTVLFVSHNLGAIQQLCSRAILLDQGTVMLDGSPQTVVSKYLSMGMDQVGERVWQNVNEAPGDQFARMRAVRVLDSHRKMRTSFDVRDPISVEIEYEVLQDRDWLEVSLYFYNEKGDLLFVSVDDVARLEEDEKRLAGYYSSLCHLPKDFLNSGQIYVLAALTADRTIHTIQRDVVSFNVTDSLDPNGTRARTRAEWPAAAVRPKLEWTVTRSPLNTAHERELINA